MRRLHDFHFRPYILSMSGVLLPLLCLFVLSSTATSRLIVQSPDSIQDASEIQPLSDLRKALNVMQESYFELWLGIFPTAIDWTAAVVNTHAVSAIATYSKALDRVAMHRHDDDRSTFAARDIENDLDRYFAQSVAYYFGEDAFAIRNEANDDMLWVVLGWLEAIKFADLHSRLHYHSPPIDGSFASWHGTQFVKAFAHRARVFYDLASRGWDTTLCDGGMIWNPNLEPYKNAITNQLFIAASVGMYLYFPGDHNTSPFVDQARPESSSDIPAAEPQDPAHLRAAVQGYEWLKNSNMTNAKGLYVDGFHVSGLKDNHTKCDARNEMVYTYNQGVLLSGLRGLWEATGNITYLTDGHTLARNTIKATGWQLNLDTPTAEAEWAGLGRAGILQDFCDARGACSQDAQTFKGIFFHHLTLFCEPLPALPLHPGKTHSAGNELARLHHQSCQEYAPWVAHNARGALNTRDSHGKFGSFWGTPENAYLETDPPIGSSDYRNNVSVLEDWPWLSPHAGVRSLHSNKDQQAWQSILTSSDRGSSNLDDGMVREDVERPKDPNDRGRGRTVETQAGGVAVLKALWELLNME